MPQFFEAPSGDSDFASIFPSIAEEKREQDERQQTEMLLKVLDELEAKAEPRRTEYMKVSITDDDENRKQREARAEKIKKVHTLDDLPRPSEYEMIFGTPGPDELEEDPLVKVSTGRRLKDGKVLHSATFPMLDNLSLNWSGISFDAICLILLGIFIMFVVVMRISSSRSRSHAREQSFRETIRSQIEAEVRMQMMMMQQPQFFQPKQQ